MRCNIHMVNWLSPLRKWANKCVFIVQRSIDYNCVSTILFMKETYNSMYPISYVYNKKHGTLICCCVSFNQLLQSILTLDSQNPSSNPIAAFSKLGQVAPVHSAVQISTWQ